MNNKLSILFALGTIFTIACGPMDVVDDQPGPGTETQVELTASPTWADDGSQYTYTKIRYTQDLTTTSNNRHQVYIRNQDGSGEYALTTERAGRPTDELYFMKSQKYILMGVYDETGAQQTSEKTYLKLHLHDNGSLKEIEEVANHSFEDCRARFFYMVPSPDGALIAKVTQQEDCEGVSGGSITIKVEFFEARDMRLINYHQITLSSDPTGWRWSDDGTQFLITNDVRTAHLSTTIRPIASTIVPSCLFPRTTSSSTRDDGQTLVVQGNEIVFGSVDLSASFGCEQIPDLKEPCCNPPSKFEGGVLFYFMERKPTCKSQYYFRQLQANPSGET